MIRQLSKTIDELEVTGMQNPPPPPPYGGQPPMMPPGRPAYFAVPGNLASPGLRIVGGLIDAIIIGVVAGLVDGVTRGTWEIAGLVHFLLALGYLGYFWNTRGQSIGMMVFNFKVRELSTGQYPSPGQALLRAFTWWLELILTFPCLIGFIGWGWQLWDANHQALHDKVAGTIVTTS